MKLVLTILRDSDWEAVSQALIQDEFRVTRISSTGGFLRQGMSTLMSIVEDDEIDQAIDTIRVNLSPQTTMGERKATVLVINVEDYRQL